MSAKLLRLPRLPVFDRETDGNPFQWIVKTAPKVRAQRQAVTDAARREAYMDRRMQVGAPVKG